MKLHIKMEARHAKRALNDTTMWLISRKESVAADRVLSKIMDFVPSKTYLLQPTLTLLQSLTLRPKQKTPQLQPIQIPKPILILKPIRILKLIPNPILILKLIQILKPILILKALLISNKILKLIQIPKQTTGMNLQKVSEMRSIIVIHLFQTITNPLSFLQTLLRQHRQLKTAMRKIVKQGLNM